MSHGPRSVAEPVVQEPTSSIGAVGYLTDVIARTAWLQLGLGVGSDTN